MDLKTRSALIWRAITGQDEAPSAQPVAPIPSAAPEDDVLDAPAEDLTPQHDDPVADAPEPAEDVTAPDIPPAWQQPFVASSELVIARGASGGHWITHVDDRWIGGSIRHSGAFEEHNLDECLAILAAQGRAIEGGRFVDIGANIGSFAIHALKNGFDDAVAIEPDPTNFRLLRANAVLHGCETRMQFFPCAVSDQDGSVVFEKSRDNLGDHRISAKENAALVDVNDEANRERITVTTRRLDAILADAGPEPAALIWIDTQGHEGHVLAGAPAVIASGAPVVIEFWPYGLERSGGKERLKDVLRHYSKIIELRQSTPDAVVEVSMDDFDALYDSYLAQESAEVAAHSDFLLIK